MLNKDQIKLVQVAVKKAGIRTPQFDGRYRLLLGKYKQPNGRPVTSCTQINNSQLEDLLAICESYGWRMPNQPEDFYRKKAANIGVYASFAQREAINHLAGDLFWTPEHLGNFIKKMTNRIASISDLTPREGFQIIEGLKAIFNRKNGTKCNTLNDIKDAAAIAGGEKEFQNDTSKSK
jgi:hypothetical protein